MRAQRGGARIAIPLVPAAGDAAVSPSPRTRTAVRGDAAIRDDLTYDDPTRGEPMRDVSMGVDPSAASATAYTAEPPFVAEPPLSGRVGTTVRAVAPTASADWILDEIAMFERIETFVQTMRPRAVQMQLRFLRTVLTAFWLFGRLIFWQVYAARFFPDMVKRGENARWRRYAREFRNFAIDMGGVMIKAGQFASTRADVLPEDIIAELADLQDRIPGVPFSRIAGVLRQELGDVDRFFAEVQQQPIAAASLGQVHRAVMLDADGQRHDVVIKIQRPGVRRLVYTDLAALFIVARVAMRFSFISRRADMVLLTEEFGRVLLEETSYRSEARNALRFSRNFAGNPGVCVPRVYPSHSTDRVLTLEDVAYIKIDDYALLEEAGIDRLAVARRLMDTYMQQIFTDRFFHADPHPGNLFVRPLPATDSRNRPFQLIFIDFGMTGTLTPEIVRGLINTLTAVITRDSRRMVQAYVDLGFILPDADLVRIEEATTAVFDQVWGMDMSQISSMDFETAQAIGNEFSDLLRELPFRVPQDFVYLGRTVSILSGMATQLDSAYNPWFEIQRYMADLISVGEEGGLLSELTTWLTRTVDEVIEDGPQGLLRIGQRLLERVQRLNRTETLLRQIVNGDVAIPTRFSTQQRQQLERIERQGAQTNRTILVSALMVCGTILYASRRSSDTDAEG